MSESVTNMTFIIFLLGFTLTGVILIKALFGRSVIPSLIGFILFGFMLRVADGQWEIFSEQSQNIFIFLSKVGVIALLFRIGLESELTGLLKQLRRASLVWITGVLVNGFAGFLVALYLLGLDLIPSLFLGVALTATSVSVPGGVWREANALRSRKGSLLIDVAELNDISGIILMVLLFTLVPHLRGSSSDTLSSILLSEAGIVILKFIAFVGMCFLFSKYVEEHLTNFMKKWVSSANVLLISLGIGFVIAALAGIAGFSVAIGAFFAGLAFSRDPNKVKMDASFDTLFEMLSPFFFIGIGLKIVPGSLSSAAGVGSILLLTAVLGKFLGEGFMTWLTGGISAFFLIGASMVPRAEITMIIMEHGLDLGEWAVPHFIFTAVVFVTLSTCLAAPLALQIFLHKWPQKEKT